MRRSNLVQIRVSDEERASWIKAAGVNHQSVSEWIRGLAQLSIAGRTLARKYLKGGDATAGSAGSVTQPASSAAREGAGSQAPFGPWMPKIPRRGK